MGKGDGRERTRARSSSGKCGSKKRDPEESMGDGGSETIPVELREEKINATADPEST